MKKDFLILSGKKRFPKEKVITAWYGCNKSFDQWDISKTKEFGYHFSVDDSLSSKHRLSLPTGEVIKAEIRYSNPLFSRDLFHWSLESILAIVNKSSIYSALKKAASISAMENGNSLRVEENLIAKNILNGMGYDAIEYYNLGELGGRAIVIWNENQISKIDQ